MGIKLKEARFEARMTQAELAKASGVSRMTIVNIEADKYENVKIGTLKKLAKALGKKVMDIFFDE